MAFTEMHIRRFASLLLGLWMGGSLLLLVVATNNFASVDRTLGSQSPGAVKIVRDLGPDNARAFLRFQAAELNRWCFEGWEWIEMGLWVVLLVIFRSRAASSGVGTALAGLMLAAVAVMHWFLTPEIARLGFRLAFVPPSGLPATREQFRQFHMVYGILEIAQIGLGMTLAAILLGRHRSHTERHTRTRRDPAVPAC
jgi:hypothetical protein